MSENKLATITNLFEGSEIRSIWNSEKEDYYFSVVDVIQVLTNSNIPKRYWADLFLMDYDLFVQKFEKLKNKLGENYIELLGEDCSLIDEMYEDD